MQVFEWELSPEKGCIPSLIAYDKDEIAIGHAARSRIMRHLNRSVYGYFKTQLPFQRFEYLNCYQEERTPARVTVDYLRELLLSTAPGSFSFSRLRGNIGKLAVSIPEPWFGNIKNQGRIKLEHLIVSELGIENKLLQLVSEPVAAAAYWLSQMQQQKSEVRGNLLVCDLGSSSFDLNLCRICPGNKIRILYSDKQEKAGFAFDRSCVELAYARKQGHPLTDDNPDFFPLLRDFEVAKISSHEKSNSRLSTYLKAPALMAEYNLYCFGSGYAVKCKEISEAFEPIERGIREVVGRLNVWMERNGQKFDFLFLIGGFSKFALTENAILPALNIEENDPRFDRSFNNSCRNFAISHGSCLIANSLADPIEKSSHTLGIVGETINVHAERERRFIPIILSGTNLDDLMIPIFPDGHSLVAYQNNIPKLAFWIDSKGRKEVIKEVELVNRQLPNYSWENFWRVGMRVSRYQTLYLVIEDGKEKQNVEYELGKISDFVVY